ncbi:MAG: hypothetical protein BZY88_05210 [SAR202 cluster bacterium Io17-Chloro-G9]|nr:MAG: hypothetical protein BZY88_05210 [SAR202 cluster bacterium Io17-Chloro-G9]
MDLVLMGGNVLTMDVRNSRAEALAVDGGKIAAVGTNAELAKLVGENTRVVHLAGRTLLPAFSDPHNHFSINTLEPVSVDCSVPPHATIGSVKDAIAAAAKDLPAGRWLTGWGFRSGRLKENRAITRWELDEAAPDNPVRIMDGSVHACYANSAALMLAGIGQETPDPPHGQIIRESNGQPNGTLWEGAMDPVYNLSLRAYLDHYPGEVGELVRHNCLRHLACGIAGVGDALVVPDAAELYRAADGQNNIPITLHQMLGAEGFFAPPQGVSNGEIGDGNVSDRLRGGTMKMFMDPVFPGSAYTRHHAHGGAEEMGQIYYTQDEADALVSQAHKRGMQVAIHCLGNRAVDRALNAFQNALKEHPSEEPRFRIEHFTITSIAQIQRARSLGVVAVVQPGFHFTGGERYRDRMQELAGDVRALPLRSMLDQGLTVSGSSDYPCGPLSPLTGLYAMVTRRTQQGGDPVTPDEAVSAMEGLRMYTATAAYAMGREKDTGSLERGKRADMVVLSHDPTAVDPDYIREIAVEQTYVEGDLLYQH